MSDDFVNERAVEPDDLVAHQRASLATSDLDESDDNEPGADCAGRLAKITALLLLSVLIIAVVSFLFIIASGAVVSEHPSVVRNESRWRKNWTQLTCHLANHMPQSVWPRHAASDSDMKPGTWRSFDMDGQEIPAMVIKQPFRDRPSCNWLSLPGTQKPANTLLVFHAAGLSLEFYYQELEKLSHMFNVRIVAVEYPGFGKRSRTSCTSESSLQARYPREVLRFCEQDLDDFAWDQTVVWSVCFGCSIGMSFLSYLLDPDTPFAETNDFDARRRMPNAVFLSKVFVSYRHCLRNVAWNRDTPLSRMPPKNMFAILPYSVGGRQVDGVPDWVAVAYRRTTCPVVISTGEQDTLCTVEDAQAVYDQFVNASWRRLNVTPGNHSDSFLEIASHEVTAFGSKRELQRLQNE